MLQYVRDMNTSVKQAKSRRMVISQYNCVKMFVNCTCVNTLNGSSVECRVRFEAKAALTGILATPFARIYARGGLLRTHAYTHTNAWDQWTVAVHCHQCLAGSLYAYQLSPLSTWPGSRWHCHNHAADIQVRPVDNCCCCWHASQSTLPWSYAATTHLSTAFICYMGVYFVSLSDKRHEMNQVNQEPINCRKICISAVKWCLTSSLFYFYV